jgi:hypothetical protein
MTLGRHICAKITHSKSNYSPSAGSAKPDGGFFSSFDYLSRFLALKMLIKN